MHFNLYFLHTALLATTTLAIPMVPNHQLTKRHFWCNGVDSENICPEGQTMVPIDDYACNAISSAGRMSQISAPVNGEKSTTCPQQVPVEKSSPPSASLESGSEGPSSAPMHLTCLEVKGAVGASVLLNCTMAG